MPKTSTFHYAVIRKLRPLDIQLRKLAKPHALIIVVLIFTTILAAGRFESFQIGDYQDDAHYIVTAQALASGQGYRLINEPSKPLEVTFPPGYPLLLTPIVFFFGPDFRLIRLFSLLLVLGSIGLAYRLLARRTTPMTAIAAVALFALNPAVVGASVMAMSEAPYLFLSLLSLNLFQEWEGKERPFNILLPGVVVPLVCTIAIRTVGVALVISFVVFLLWRRKCSHLGALLGCLALAASPLLLYNMSLGGLPISPAYGQFLLGPVGGVSKLEQVWLNIRNLVSGQLVEFMVPIGSSRIPEILEMKGMAPLWVGINIAFLGLIGVGTFNKNARGWFVEGYVLMYLLSLLPYTYPDPSISAMPRYLIPITPFLALFLVTGLYRVLRACFSLLGRLPAVRTVVIVTLGALCFLYAVRNVQDIRDPIRNRITDISIGATWISENTPADSIVMSPEPISKFLYTHRLTVDFPSQGNGPDFLHNVRQLGVNYVIVAPPLVTPRTNELDWFVKQTVLPALMHSPGASVVFKDDAHNVTVYRISGE